MIRLSATAEETAALDAKFEACRRENWAMLGMPSAPVERAAHPAMNFAWKYTEKQIRDMMSRESYNNQLAVDGQ